MEEALLKTGDWSSSNITKLTNSAATEAAIESAINSMKNSEDSDDVCLFMFSGHCGNSSPIGLRPHNDYQRSITPSELGTLFNGFNTDKIVVILDCCYAGIFDGYINNGFTLMACQYDKKSLELPSLNNGVFSYYVTNGFKGYADMSGTAISAEEVFLYAEPRTSSYTENYQNPEDTDNYSGALNALIKALTLSGSLSHDEIWSTITLTDNVTIPSGKEVEILIGSTIYIPPNKKVTVNGTLTSYGTTSSPITFTKSSTNKWYGIDFNSTGKGQFKYCNFTNAIVAITKSGSGNQVNITNDCRFTNNYSNIEGYYNSGQYIYVTDSYIEYADAEDCIYLYDSGAYLHGNEINGKYHDSNGISAYFNYGDQEGLAIFQNDIYDCISGVFCYEGAAMIQMSDIYSNSTGVYAYRYSEPWFREDSEDGLNVITDNYRGILISSNSDADLNYGWNTIAGNSNKNLANYNTYVTIPARDNYWGATPPPTSKFYGNIYYSPYKSSDQTGRYPSGYLSKTAENREVTNSFESSQETDETMYKMYKDARALEQSKDHHNAVQKFKEVIDYDPNHDLAVSALHKLIRNNNRLNKDVTSTIVREILVKHSKSNVVAWARKYEVSESVKSGHLEYALDLSKSIVSDFPGLSVAKDALYEQWIINFVLLRDTKAAESVISDYESSYGFDENLIRMKFKSGKINSKTANLLKGQIADKQSSPPAQTALDALPQTYSLSKNYPNPFNPKTTIPFTLPKAAHVKIEIYNLAGQLVETLSNQDYNPGYHHVNFSAHHLSSGFYFTHLEISVKSDNPQLHVFTNKMMLLK